MQRQRRQQRDIDVDNQIRINKERYPCKILDSTKKTRY